jgi:hypothetical protein
MNTFRFYTSKDYGHIYKGWLKSTIKNLDQVKSWLNSGNIIHWKHGLTLTSFQGKEGWNSFLDQVKMGMK